MCIPGEEYLYVEINFKMNINPGRHLGFFILKFFGRIAQPVEQGIVSAQVDGSCPSVSSLNDVVAWPLH